MVTDFTSLPASLILAKERAGAPDSAEPILTDFLELSKAPNADGLIHYRPFLTAALWIEQDLASQTIKEADGVKFTGRTTSIGSLRNFQQAADRALGLAVPMGFEANPVTSTESETSSVRKPGSFAPTLVF